MEARQIFELIEALEKRFKSKVNQVALDIVWSDLLAVHSDAYAGALRRLMTETNTMPTVARISDVLQVEGKKAALRSSDNREREWNKTKDTARGQGGKPEAVTGLLQKLSAAAHDEHAMMTVQVLVQMYRTDKTEAQKLEFFREMNSRYPQLEWAREGMYLQKFWEKRAAGQEHRMGFAHD